MIMFSGTLLLFWKIILLGFVYLVWFGLSFCLFQNSHLARQVLQPSYILLTRKIITSTVTWLQLIFLLVLSYQFQTLLPLF